MTPAPLKETSFIDRILPTREEYGFRMPGYWVWCGSAIQGDDGRYHLFASRWSKRLPMFAGYILSSEIVRAVADVPQGPYRFVEKVLPGPQADRWDGRMAHNPSIHKVGHTYLLYYIGTTFRGETESLTERDLKARCDESYANIRIGLAMAESLEGPWTLLDTPVLEPRPGRWDGRIVTNPAPCARDDGQILLFYRSNTPEGLRIGVAGASDFRGAYQRLSDDPVLQFSSGDFVEDPYVWWAGDHYEMLAKDILGGITGEVHAGAHLQSPDGLHWQPVNPPKAYSRQVLFAGGERRRLGCLERPQLLFDANKKPICLFAAAADGPGGFHQAHNTWNQAIPLDNLTSKKTWTAS